MAGPFDSGGYEDLRSAIQDRWTHVALIDSGGNEETRISVPGDVRAQWTNSPASNPITLSVTISAGDSDISTPTTIIRAELYKSSSATTRMDADSISSNQQRTLEAANDEQTITWDIEEPDI